jgi:hypothetical protein
MHAYPTAASPMPQSPIDNALVAANAELDELEGRISTLASRLTPVLAPCRDSGERQKEAPNAVPPPRAPLQDSIDDLASRTRAQNVRLTALLDYLQL